jgi:spore coat polysaccharide biosynthesis protein SpsF (cytidylyltransferase family)
MKVIAVVQARMSSKRLPGKVLLEAAGQPLILHLFERVQRSPGIDSVWLATSEEDSDDILSDTVESRGFQVFRGSLDHVLSRYWNIAKNTRADVIVRLTGDCPLHDPAIIGEVLAHFTRNWKDSDYVSNVSPPTYPDGLDTEVFTFEALDRAYRNATETMDIEHVTPYIRRTALEIGRVKNHYGPADFSHLRWTLDENEDFELIRQVFEDLYPAKGDFGWLDVLAWQTREPKRLEINARYARNEGLRNATPAGH